MSTIKLYMDAHIPKGASEQLRARGVNVVRCQEVNMADASDLAHLEYAVREGRTIVTGDDDFLRLHAQWISTGKQHCGIMYVLPQVRHWRKATISVLVSELLFYHEAVEAGAASLEQDVYNQVVYLSGMT